MRVLHILNGLNIGGAEAFLKNLRKSLPDDIQMDFLLRTQINDDETCRFFKEHGSQIYIVPSFPKQILANRRETAKFLRDNCKRYDYIHIHANSLFYFFPIQMAVKLYGSERVIVHSHNTSSPSKISDMIHARNRRKLHHIKCVKLSCGENAGQWMFENDKFQVINNGIDLEKFENSELIREQLRRKYHIESKLLLCVGRLVNQKNHIFLIPVMKELVKKRPDIQLWICGDGALHSQLKEKIVENSLQNNIVLLGNRMDIPELLKAADVYLMPSIFEGLTIAAIEAQATGITCIFSDAIPEETCKGDNVLRIPLKEKHWIDAIEDAIEAERFTYNNTMKIETAGYGLSTLRDTMLKIYQR